MNEESRPARRLSDNVTGKPNSRCGGRGREHELDRMVIAAVWRSKRAREGRGYRFQLPPSLRETA